MVREWQPNGSNYDYWRSDNPLIQGWWRFGGSNPKNNFQTPEEKSTTNYLSGILVDSGPQKHHLKPFFLSSNDAGVLVPVPSIAPWDSTGSGLQFRWLNTTDNKMIYADPSVVTQQQSAASQSMGTLGAGTPMYSGFTVICWLKLTDKLPLATPAFTTEQTIVGRDDQDGGIGTKLMWRLSWSRLGTNQYSLNGTYLSALDFVFPAATRVTSCGINSNAAAFPSAFNVTTFTTPNFPLNRDEAFFAVFQVRRENVETNRSFTPNGSGSIH